MNPYAKQYVQMCTPLKCLPASKLTETGLGRLSESIKEIVTRDKSYTREIHKSAISMPGDPKKRIHFGLLQKQRNQKGKLLETAISTRMQKITTAYHQQDQKNTSIQIDCKRETTNQHRETTNQHREITDRLQKKQESSIDKLIEIYLGKQKQPLDNYLMDKQRFIQDACKEINQGLQKKEYLEIGLPEIEHKKKVKRRKVSMSLVSYQRDLARIQKSIELEAKNRHRKDRFLRRKMEEFSL